MKKHTFRTLRGFKTSVLEPLAAFKAFSGEIYRPIIVLGYELLKAQLLKCIQAKKRYHLKRR